MTEVRLKRILEHIRGVAASETLDERPDACLLDGFVRTRDESAFAVLLRRHGPMVLGVCRRVLHNSHDAEDACQATFLVLAKKAASIRKQESVGSFLHGVAYRLSCKLKAGAARRRLPHPPPPPAQVDPCAEAGRREFQAVLDDELRRLPRQLRLPLILCYLQSRTRDEAARQLGWPLATFRGRLERGRSHLRRRLLRRGFSPSAVLGSLLAGPADSAGLPARFTTAAWRAASSGPALALAGGMARGPGRLKLVLALTLALSLGAGAGALAVRAIPSPDATQAPAAVPEGPGGDDRRGGPPPRAVTRLGTSRFRQGAGVFYLAFAPDGKTLVSGNRDCVACWWDVAGGEERVGRNLAGPRLAALGAQMPLPVLALSPDGTTLATAFRPPDGKGSRVHLWDAATGAYLRALGEATNPLQGDVKALAFSADGKTLAAGTQHGTLALWATRTGRQLFRAQRSHQTYALAFSPDGKLLALGSDGGAIHLWDPATHDEVGALLGHRRAVVALSFSADGALLTSADYGDPARVWDVPARKELRKLAGHRYETCCVAFSPDGGTLATADHYEEGILLWDPGTGRQCGSLPGHPGGVQHLAFSADGKTLASGGVDGVIRLWDPAAGRERLAAPDAHLAPANRLAFSPDGRLLASASDDHTVRTWDPATGKPLHTLRGHRHWVRAVAFSPARRGGGTPPLLATSGLDDSVRLWDAATGEPVRTWKGHGLSGGTNALTFTAGGEALLSYGGDGKLRSWDAATGAELPGMPRAVRLPPDPSADERDGPGSFAATFSPDGQRLAVALGRLIHVVAVATGETILSLRGHGPGSLLSVAFSPDGRLLASGGGDRTLRLWELASGQEVLYVEGQDIVSAVAFAPDGRTVAASTDGAGHAIHLWDVGGGSRRSTLRGHTAGTRWLTFAPDGRRLVSSHADTTALVWDLTAMPGGVVRHGPWQADPWAALAGADAAQAHAAVWGLAATPQKAVALLQDRLAGSTARRARLEKLIAGLDADDFATREAAARELERSGTVAEPALRRALLGRPSVELRRRVEALLSSLETPPRSEGLRITRALQVLELVGTSEARRLLHDLAAPGPQTMASREARAVLRRLEAGRSK